MRGFALSLAYAGYVVVLWDFDGHGTNPRLLPLTTRLEPLITDAETALAEVETRGLGDPDRVAILVHSMGSGVTR